MQESAQGSERYGKRKKWKKKREKNESVFISIQTKQNKLLWKRWNDGPIKKKSLQLT